MSLLLLVKLMMGHALADFALQNPDMAKLKNRNNKPDPSKIPAGQKPTPCWFYFLTAHALIHGGTVWVITDVWQLGIMEVCAHWIIDFAKCENKTNPHVDQLLHFLCKVFYVYLMSLGGS